MRLDPTASMYRPLHKAVLAAINEVGLENFKKISWFQSNEMKKNQNKRKVS